MNRRHAHLIRCGIRAARDPELRQYVHLAPRLVREACRRELERIPAREHIARLDARIAKLDAAHLDQWDGYSLPHRHVIGLDPATISAEQAEHLRRFYA